MKRRLRVIVPLLAVALVGALILWSSSSRDRKTLQLSGTIETREINIGSKVAGRVIEVPAEEGQLVKAGAVLVRFESDELNAQRDQLRAKIDQAQADLARFERGYRPEEIRQAEAAAGQQHAAFEAARNGPREQEVQQAHADYAAAKAEALNADLEFQRMEALFKSGDIARQRYDDARALRDSTAARAESARQRLSMLQEGTRPEDRRLAEQRYKQAQANAELLRRGYRQEDIQAARGRVAEVRAGLAELETRLRESELRAPADARVQVVSVRPGDLVQPGRIVVTLLEASQLWVKVYVPEPELGRVSVGQKATVRIDTFPDRTFEGAVESISSQAEFLPRNVQTLDDRQHQVFGVKIHLDNRDGTLKSGMAASVKLS